MLCSNQLCIENDSSSVEFYLFLAQNRLHSLSTSTCVSVRAQSPHNSIPFPPPSTLAYSHHQPPRTQLTWTARQKPDIELVRSQVATVSLSSLSPLLSLSLSHILLLFISFCFALSLSSSHCLLCKAVNTLTNIFRAMQCTKNTFVELPLEGATQSYHYHYRYRYRYFPNLLSNQAMCCYRCLSPANAIIDPLLLLLLRLRLPRTWSLPCRIPLLPSCVQQLAMQPPGRQNVCKLNFLQPNNKIYCAAG